MTRLLLCVLWLGTALQAAAAPLPSGGGNLSAEQEKEVRALQARRDRHLTAGEFEQAAEAAREIATYRAKHQGAGHWQAIDARYEAEKYQRLVKVEAKDRPQVVRARQRNNEGLGLVNRGKAREAEEPLRQALAICQKILGEQHPHTASSYDNVASCLDDQGKHAEALPLYQKALQIRQKALGERHPHTAQSYNSVASCLDDLGKHAEALPLYQKALQIRQEALGEQHPHTANSYNNVAYCLKARGKPGEALPQFQKALAIYLKARGEQHPSTAASYNNVAACLHALGKHAEALPLLQKVLAIYLKARGEQHPSTAASYNNVAACLHALGKHAEALPLLQKALAIRQKALGEQHPHTAQSHNNVAFCLQAQGKHPEALPLYQKALQIYLKALGEQHPDTASSYNNVASCLDAQGKHSEALPLYRKALQIRRKALGEQHPHTASSYNNVAVCLDAQGNHAEALPLLQRALQIRRKALGEQHPHTANSYNNVALCLDAQGKHAEALPLLQRALLIRRNALGEQHPLTAGSYNSVASCLHALGKHAEALPLFQKALQIRQKALGEQHPHTANSYNDMAGCLGAQGKHVEALPLFQKALKIRQKALGEQHPRTAHSYNNVAACLDAQGKHAEALPLFQNALKVCLKALGEQHPDTAISYNNVAACLWAQGKRPEAVALLETSLPGQEAARFHAASSGFDRAIASRQFSPHTVLAVGLALQDKPTQAFRHAESSFARGLLDDLASLTEEDRQRLSDLSQALAAVDKQRVPLLGLQKPSDEQKQLREDLTRRRRTLTAQLGEAASEVSRRQVRTLPDIQKHVPPDAALVCWLGFLGDQVGCVVRREGPPRWVALPGSGKDNRWTQADGTLPFRTYQSLTRPDTPTALRDKLTRALYAQRLAPLEEHLAGVKHLLVVPTSGMAAVPLEALTSKWTISYVPSGSALAQLMEKHRPLKGESLLVLADPNYTQAKPRHPEAPPHGLLVKEAPPKSLASRVGLRPGDVLLEYDGTKLTKPADLKYADKAERVPVKLWREGKGLGGRIPAGDLGVVVDERPLAEALAAWREERSRLLGLRGKEWHPLPGTRLEAASLKGLVPSATVLLGSDASEQRLEQLARSGELRGFRLLHLATHGEAVPDRPRRTALILAQDHLPSPEEQQERALAGRRPIEGRLEVGTLLEDAHWRLDADLVVLSACQTGLGKRTRGEGMLGFAQALLMRGARSVVLSRWQVDDTATALLMRRFYENLLGKREGLKRPLERALALAEAKAWLRTLPRKQALARSEALHKEWVRRGIKGTRPLPLPDNPARAERPFAHPSYWAAFVLVGDPN